MMLDNAIVAGIAVLSAAALSWTGIGAGISLAVAGVECARILKLWGDATKIISGTQAAIVSFVGFIQSMDAQMFEDIKAAPMPASDYDHPAVAPAPARPRQKGEL